MRDDRQPAFVRHPRPFVSQHDEADFELVAGDADERRFAGPRSILQRGGHSHVRSWRRAPSSSNASMVPGRILIGQTREGTPGSVEVAQAAAHLEDRYEVWRVFDDLHETLERCVAGAQIGGHREGNVLGALSI